MSDAEYKGKCFCGAVELTVIGKPTAAGYCHCTSCRKWSAGPVNAFTLWPVDAVRIDSGQDKLASFSAHPQSERRWCTACGGHVLTAHPPLGLIDVYAATIADFPFAPALHINYQERVLRVHDGLPKMKDVPEQMGGSGETLPE
jgi:hypothetical protein